MLAGRVLVSTAGGAQVRWRSDGKALFYIALDNRIMETPLEFGPGIGSVAPGTPVALFASVVPGGALQPFPRHQYAVMPDGRFLMVAGRKDSITLPLTLLLNWTGKKD